MRHPVTDVALLAYIANKNLGVVSYTEATKACKSSSSASRALHQLIREGLLDPQPKLLGLRYVTQYVVTQRGKQVARLALQLTQLRDVAKASRTKEEEDLEVQRTEEEPVAEQTKQEDEKYSSSKDLEEKIEEKKPAPSPIQQRKKEKKIKSSSPPRPKKK